MPIDDNIPMFLENAGLVYNAREYRRLLESIFIGPGILAPTDFEVTASTPPAMTVDVQGGALLVAATTGDEEGLYYVRNVGAELDVELPLPDALNPYWVRFGVQVRDSEHDGGLIDNDDTTPPIVVIAGTPAGSPTKPAYPDNTEPLGALLISPTDIVAGAIVDERRLAPREHLDTQALTWTDHTADADLASWTIPPAPLAYPVMVRPEISVGINPDDAVAWDLSLEVWTGAGGTGTFLGKQGLRNPGINQRHPMIVPCDELFIAAGSQVTLRLRANYSTATPTTGFTPSSTSDNVARTIIRPTWA